jgi:hypothetical protein
MVGSRLPWRVYQRSTLMIWKEKVDQEIEAERLALEKQCWSRVATQLEALVGIKYDVSHPLI